MNCATTSSIGTSISNGCNGTSARGALPPSVNSKGGTLSVTILTAYDLPAREQPVSVTLSCLDQSVVTGAPSARHKDRNSFKFPQNEPLVIQGKLSDLYKSTAILTVNYRTVEKNVGAAIQVSSLKIHETTWLILNLGPYDDMDHSQDDGTDHVPPTLRLQVRLEGPYRPEIAALLTLGNAWFGTVDHGQHYLQKLMQGIPQLPDKKYFLVPAVPFATALVVLSPIVIGVLVVGLPFLLPIVVVLLTTLVACSGGLLAIYASTESGRSQVGNLLSPLVHTILSTASGQRLVYETGPRPTPVSVARVFLPKDLMGKLLVSLLIDLIGSSSYLLPVVGEGFDIGWAPIQTILIMAMYDHVSPQLKYVSFIEEILPFTDVVPSATIGWLTEFGPQVIAGSNNNLKRTPTKAGANTGSVLRSTRQ